MSALELDSLSKIYGGVSTAEVIFDGLSLTIAEHSVVSVLGRSGVGKSTLLRIIAGLDMDYSGDVRVRGALVRGPGSEVGLVFQDNRLLPWMRARQNVAFSLPDGLSRHAKLLAADAALDLVDLKSAAERWPRELSGGMSKRVAIARALAPKPSILLLDEPFSGLDPGATATLSAYLTELALRRAATILLVMHDVDAAIQISDRLIVLNGKPAQVNMDVSLRIDDRKYSSSSYPKIRQDLIECITR